MNIRYRVTLSQTERDQLTALLNGGKHASRKLKRAQMLAADAGIIDDTIAATLSVSGSTVYRTKRASWRAILSLRRTPRGARKLTGGPAGRHRVLQSPAGTRALDVGPGWSSCEHEDLSYETAPAS